MALEGLRHWTRMMMNHPVDRQHRILVLPAGLWGRAGTLCQHYRNLWIADSISRLSCRFDQAMLVLLELVRLPSGDGRIWLSLIDGRRCPLCPAELVGSAGGG